MPGREEKQGVHTKIHIRYVRLDNSVCVCVPYCVRCDLVIQVEMIEVLCFAVAFMLLVLFVKVFGKEPDDEV
jgi:hypothetical protein